MPLYEYRCEQCGDVFEVIQKFADAPLTVHQKCGGGPVVRLLSAPAFHLKGSGWYATDYAKKTASTPTANAESKESSGKNDAKNESGKSKSGDAAPAPATTPASSSSSSSSSGSSDTK